jgi:uncharacterized RDD family membrane protein YckC
MQCSSCRAVYSNGLSLCPRCQTPATKPATETEIETQTATQESTLPALEIEEAETNDSAQVVVAAPSSSTLIEFPGTTRASRPQWRKELSARVREIQERRAREAEEVAVRDFEQEATEAAAAPQLGLVPTPGAPEVNPIVLAALKRLERARQSTPPMPRPRASMGGAAAAATARVIAEQYETEPKPVLAQVTISDTVSQPTAKPETAVPPPTKTHEPAREHQLVIVPDQPAPKVTASANKSQSPKIVAKIVDDRALPVSDELKASGSSSDEIPVEEIYDDRAPALSRIVAGSIDLLVVAFAASPFAAIIELTNGNWADWRVIASIGGIVLILMFLYSTASTALAGRTLGMSQLSLRPVDVETGRPLTTKQSVGRAILYIVSLLSCGLGLLYALFDAEGRAVHDHLSGTVVVRD